MCEKPLQPDLAAYLISEIQKQLSPNMELAKSIEPVLGLSRSAMYKRLRGESAFTVDELVALARHFKIPVDDFVLEQTGIIALEFPALSTPVRSTLDFLAGIEQQLLLALELPEVKLFYASAEIPLFCYLKFPELITFKLYMWSRTSWLLPEFDHQKFSFANFPNRDKVLEKADSILKLYCQLPGCEFWSLHMLENTLNQIDFLIYEGGFAEPEMARTICTQIFELIDWQHLMAERGSKIDSSGKIGAELQLYHNEIAHTNNTLLLQATSFRKAFFTFDNPNFGTGVNHVFCDYAENWFSRLQRCSIRISKEGEKQRIRFFEKLQRRARQKIEEIIPENQN